MKKIIAILLLSNLVSLFMIAYAYEHAYLAGHKDGMALGYLLQGRRNVEISKAIHSKRFEQAISLVTENIADAVDYLAPIKDSSAEERNIYSAMRAHFLDETKDLSLRKVPMKSVDSEKNVHLLSVRQKVLAQ